MHETLSLASRSVNGTVTAQITAHAAICQLVHGTHDGSAWGGTDRGRGCP